MKIKRFTAENFRNIENCDLGFKDGVNLLYGSNAQGKTNAIEGIYLFARGKSFRGAEDRDLKKFNAEGFRLFIEYEDKYGLNTLEYASFGRERVRKKNGYKLKKLSEMIGNFKAVLFFPDNLSLVKDGPEERRGFLNVAIAQCYPTYIDEYSAYKEALENKNKLLKAASKGLYFDRCEIESFSEIMAEHAAMIYKIRLEYVRLLSKYAALKEKEISSLKEELEILYKSDIEEELTDTALIKEEYKKIFTSSIDKEIAVGSSLYGPHRDDLLINLNGNSARVFASQGQQRSVVLSMKLAEGEIIRKMYGEYPVFLFDDVLSELDKERREFVLGKMEGMQVIITSCSPEEIIDGAEQVTEVKEGKYVPSYR